VSKKIKPLENQAVQYTSSAGSLAVCAGVLSLNWNEAVQRYDLIPIIHLQAG